jgi:hypothetical protein
MKQKIHPNPSRKASNRSDKSAHQTKRSSINGEVLTPLPLSMASEATAKPPCRQKYTAALCLGFFTRQYSQVHLDDALAVLITEMRPTAFNALNLKMHAIQEIRRQLGLLDPQMEPLRLAQQRGALNQELEIFLIPALTSLADHALLEGSKYRPLYEIGAALAELETLSSHDAGQFVDQARARLDQAIANCDSELVAAIPILLESCKHPNRLMAPATAFSGIMANIPEVNVGSVTPVNPVRRFFYAVVDTARGLHDLSPKSTVRLSKAEKRIVDLIRETGHRMTTNAIMAGLETHNGSASLGTTKGALAALGRRDVLDNRQDVVPNGYGLFEWSLEAPGYIRE